ncbi:hypothetical protein SCLCIDRAFT_140885 [Scleroderma citrinum Foug A]|uniref:SAP domain-containing protein n=1 Tax=Scleroderma citrinum Foug A TaxID=1036808 RepID=A0A0C2YS90_9AGAM|nr:hypothetical protein SCLCIDRAFT_140885 [Scleroderma citrinum Foug A]
MSAATQILFNSPALHSLKRDQLVKLCKTHSLKANGKNKDLIVRLQQHAKTLPPDDPLSIATRSDNLDAKEALGSESEGSGAGSDYTGTPSRSFPLPRPSEQWEMVMDSIPEVDEETLRSNRGGNLNSQAGEFGTNGTKASSVTSSLKAIATSLCLKRNASTEDAPATSSSSSLSSKETVHSSSTLPTSDPSPAAQNLPPVDPIPGQLNLRGMPAPANARLSITQAPTTTTIRLVSGGNIPADVLSPPRLKPFVTTFDLVPATPKANDVGGCSVPVWPLSPGGVQNQNIYPSLDAFSTFGDVIQPEITQLDSNDCSDMDIDIPGALDPIQEPTPKRQSTTFSRLNTGATPKSTEKPSLEPVDIFSPAPKPQKASTRSRVSIARTEPFIFGSPLPQHNLSNRAFRSAAQSVLDEMNKRLADEGIESVGIDVLQNKRERSTGDNTDEPIVTDKTDIGGATTAMFEKVHQDTFDKMESIVQYTQKRARAPEPILSKKRKSSLVIKERKPSEPAARRRASGLRVASGVSKAKVVPGGFGDEDDDDEDVGQRRMSKRPRLERETLDEPVAEASGSSAPAPNDTHKHNDEEEKKQKERELIRKRLEYNKAKRRSSMGRPSLGGRAPPSQKPKAASRFGFLSTAKSIVQSVWNRGAGTSATSRVPVPKSAPRKEEVKPPPAAPHSKKVAAVPGSSGPPPVTVVLQAKRAPSGGAAPGRPTIQSTTSRSTLAPPMSSAEGSGTTSSRTSRAPIPFFSPPAAVSTKGSHSRNNSVTGISSLGMKGRSSGSTSHISSMGSRTSIRGTAANNHAKAPGSIVRSRPSSTLMAPTASSLAKVASLTRTHGSLHTENTNSIRSGMSKTNTQRDVNGAYA